MSTQIHLFDAPPPAPAIMLPQKLILASAGSGKTYQIAANIIMLLAHGARPDELFASTFTRKAASEILERVLGWLAAASLEEKEAGELAAVTRIAGGGTDFWNGVLERTVSELHRLNIGTLDAFFMRSVRSFGHDLGLPPTWEIADEPTAARVRAEALGEVLRHTDAGVLVELVRAISRDRVRNSVHGALLREAEVLLALHEGLDPAAEEPWTAIERLLPAGFTTEDASPAARQALADHIAAVEAPLTRAGTPVVSWTRSLARAAEALRRSAWEELIGDGICCKVLCGETSYDRREIEPRVQTLFERACAMARGALVARFARQSAALGRFAALFAEAVDRQRRATGAFRFDDLTRLLGGEDAIARRPDLFYRLDMQTRHILLDEFQDTSLAQWEALEPLVGELFSSRDGERAGVIVADPKQSIYGWRGATPRIIEKIIAQYEPATESLARSWRSSPVVLDLVNHIFHSVEKLPMWGDDPVGQQVAAEWKRGSYSEHVAAKETLPGYAAVHVGPADEGRGQQRPRLCRRAAELTARLHADAPGASIGVLTRTNRTVARILFELKRLGVAASGEGGNPLTDAPAVAALLALLRLADHPGDTIARYHVAETPLGAAVGLTAWNDEREARVVAHRLRTRLVEDGYGATLAAIAADIEHACDARERRRVAQLVELAFRHDERATLRPADFVRIVETESVEDPMRANVRVMTVHQSKGLEFDIVVLPELDSPLTRPPRGGPLAWRAYPTSRVSAVFPYIGKKLQPLFSDFKMLTEAREQAHDAAMRDALSGLYVALTRARNAVHIVVKPDGDKPGTARTAARLVREALGADGPASEGDVLFEHGDPAWCAALRRSAVGGEAERGEAEREEAERGAVAERTAAAHSAAAEHASAERAGGGAGWTGVSPVPAVRLKPATRRTRVLPRRSPSDLEGGDAVDLRHVLRLDAAVSAERGTLAHAWFEQVGWIEDGAPADDVLRDVARRVAPAMAAEDVDAMMERFRGWLETPAIRAALSRSASPAAGEAGEAEVEVEREVPFLRREGEVVIEGFIDRLVLVRRGGKVVRARILDFKTDAVEPGDAATLAARVAFYRPQLEAYRRAVTAMYRLPADAVTAQLIFLNAGVVA